MIENRNHSGLHGYLQREIDRWQSEEINIGIIGASGVGKSTFINRIRGVTKGHPGFAKVGFKGDTTTDKKAYPHPHNAKVVFWDLPGVGTPKFAKNQSYLDLIEIEKLEFFLIFYRTTIHDGEIWIAKEMEKHSKKFSFVCTHAQDLYNDDDYDDNLSPEERIEEIKTKCRDTMREEGLPNPVSVYVIDNKKPECGDFHSLVDFFLNGVDGAKREALILTLGAMTKGLIEEKRKVLKSQAWKVAVAAGFIAATPIPLVDLAANTTILITALGVYLQTFELTEDDLKEIPGAYEMEELTCRKIFRQGIKEFCVAAITKLSLVAAVEYLVPIFGSIIAGASSFTIILSFMNETIDLLAKDSEMLLGLRVVKVLSQRAIYVPPE